jgi:NAD(P)H-hydrate epimerase
MKIFKTSEIKKIDEATIKNEPISSIDLMQRAAYTFSHEFLKLRATGITHIFAGAGNNGGDAFFVTQKLLENHYKAKIYYYEEDKLSADYLSAKELFMAKFADKMVKICGLEDLPIILADDFIIDGLFGSGLNRTLTGFYAEIVKYINSSEAKVVSIDIPSGLMGEDNKENIEEHIIKADYTFTFQFPKLSFFFAENEKFVGKFTVLDIGLDKQSINEMPTNFYLTDENVIKKHLKTRNKFSHKGTFGHALLIGGSYGKMGALVLSAQACMRSGVGLLTVHVPQCGYEITQISIPEAMVEVDVSEKFFYGIDDISTYSSIGIGVGLGKAKETVNAFEKLLMKLDCPAVFDADALNILSENKDMLKHVPMGSIFTPHPKEFDRLAGNSSSGYERLQKAISFAKENKIYIVLKGAYTAVVCPNGDCYFNPTGNPGMATAGSGDVLCGIITGLLAQQYTPFEAAVIGTFFHGKAGDEAAKKHSEAGMIASDIVEALRIDSNNL